GQFFKTAPPTHTHSQQAGCRTLSLPTSLQNIFAWCGGKSNILERNKARDLALAIRDSERQGKAQVEIVTDGEEPAEMIQVLGPKPALKEGNPEEDLTADRTNAQAAALYKVGTLACPGPRQGC
ncbi:macrophage-capping protein-like, partial [Ailuropoda melanoleuca]